LTVTAVSLNKDIEFGDQRITLQAEKGPLTMHRQILAGLQQMTADYVFLCESDVLYHPSHFEYTPRRPDVFYYDVNVWKTWYPGGHCIWTDDLQQVSGCVASRDLLLDFYTRRIAQIEKDGFNKHYEPGVKQTIYPPMKGGKYGVQNYCASLPNLDIRHENTLTYSKRKPTEYRNPEYAKGWKEAGEVPGWGVVEGRLVEILEQLRG
jgi:hypothetical protein